LGWVGWGGTGKKAEGWGRWMRKVVIQAPKEKGNWELKGPYDRSKHGRRGNITTEKAVSKIRKEQKTNGRRMGKSWMNQKGVNTLEKGGETSNA